jgi:hypothetical protein
MTFVAGQKIRASDINEMLPGWGYVIDDVSVASSTALAAVPGLAVTLDANTRYAVDGYLAYVAGETGDIKVALVAPTGSTGHWTLYGQATSATGGVGSMDVRRANAFGTATTLAAAGNDTSSGYMAAMPRAYLLTGSTAGTLQLHFAQNISNATATVVRAGCWLRAMKLT